MWPIGLPHFTSPPHLSSPYTTVQYILRMPRSIQQLLHTSILHRPHHTSIGHTRPRHTVTPHLHTPYRIATPQLHTSVGALGLIAYIYCTRYCNGDGCSQYSMYTYSTCSYNLRSTLINKWCGVIACSSKMQSLMFRP